jgi:hypothetical protein
MKLPNCKQQLAPASVHSINRLLRLLL